VAAKTDEEIRAEATAVAGIAIATAREAAAEYIAGVAELSSGIVLALRDVPPLAVRQANLAIPIPDPPSVYIEDRDRHEDNPSDPDYLAAVEDRDTIVYQAGVNVALVMGTSCESVPDGHFRPEEDGWIEELDAGGIPVDTSTEARRYLNWLHLYALRTSDDLRRVTYSALVRAGLLEAEIAAAVASFLSVARQRPDHGSGPPGPGDDGDSISTDDPGAGS
jgi:hypothetical protein